MLMPMSCVSLSQRRYSPGTRQKLLRLPSVWRQAPFQPLTWNPTKAPAASFSLAASALSATHLEPDKSSRGFLQFGGKRPFSHSPGTRQKLPRLPSVWRQAPFQPLTWNPTKAPAASFSLAASALSFGSGVTCTSPATWITSRSGWPTAL